MLINKESQNKTRADSPWSSWSSSDPVSLLRPLFLDSSCYSHCCYENSAKESEVDLCKKKKAEVTNKSAKAAAALGALLAPSVQQEPLQKINKKSLFTVKG